jgi:CheY-like chemotaxis protein
MSLETKILVVDDVEFFRDVMCQYLNRTPAKVLQADNGGKTLELARRERPSLIYLDVDMPGMSGIECCRRLKADPELEKIPVVLIFTPGRDATVEEVQDSGCDSYLSKPFSKEEFLNLGHRFLFHVERRELRASCQMTVDFTIAGQTFQGRGYDLSSHGIYVEWRDELPPGRLVKASFLLPTVSPHLVEARGRISWINQGFPRQNLKVPQGFGMQFQSLSDKSAEVIMDYINQR